MDRFRPPRRTASGKRFSSQGTALDAGHVALVAGLPAPRLGAMTSNGPGPPPQRDSETGEKPEWNNAAQDRPRPAVLPEAGTNPTWIGHVDPRDYRAAPGNT